MPKKLLQRFLPEHHVLKEHKHLQFLGEHLHNPNLWHLNRHSAALACAVGLFTMYLPIPGQMIVAAVLALFVGANLPLSVVLVWITNPLTWGPMFYPAYKLGAWILGTENKVNPEGFNLLTEMGDIFWPLLIGSLIFGSVLAVLGYFGMQAVWRWATVKRWQKRKQRTQSPAG
jgi:hypothetical protein